MRGDEFHWSSERRQIIRCAKCGKVTNTVLRSLSAESDTHFTVDGALIQAWASQKSFRLKDPAATARIFMDRSEPIQRTSPTTDPDARPYMKSYGKGSKPSYPGHAVVENPNGLIAATLTTRRSLYVRRES